MHWRVKGLIQKTLGYLPLGYEAHYFLQRHLGNLKNGVGEFQRKVDDWQIMARILVDAGQPIAGAKMVEVGSGWYPTFPLAFYLGGAQRITTFDLTRHVKPGLTRQCANLLGRNLDLIATTAGVPAAEVGERYRHLMAHLDDRLDFARATSGVIDYRAPADARRTELPAGSVDCLFSNSVLEHIPPEIIDGIFREGMRILKPGAIMLHSVNCGDHYAYIDGAISQLHYLRYSESGWRLWQNRFLYQNRMRAPEFIDMAERLGFAIALNTAHPTEDRLRELRQVPVHASFSRFTPEQLCITSVDFIARKLAADDVAAVSAGDRANGGHHEERRENVKRNEHERSG